MRVITLNANGIRSAARRGFFAWAQTQAADVICLQETRAQEHQLPPDAFALPGFASYFVDAKRRGYSGVALFSRSEPLEVRRSLGWEILIPKGVSSKRISAISPSHRSTCRPGSRGRRGRRSK